jgi:hypothetical protein
MSILVKKYQKRFFSWGKLRLSPFGMLPLCNWPIVTAPDDVWAWSIWWNENYYSKPKYSEETCHSATLSTTNYTWPDLGSNPGRRGKLATKPPELWHGPSIRRDIWRIWWLGVGWKLVLRWKVLHWEGGVTGCIVILHDPIVSLRPTAAHCRVSACCNLLHR